MNKYDPWNSNSMFNPVSLSAVPDVPSSSRPVQPWQKVCFRTCVLGGPSCVVPSSPEAGVEFLFGSRCRLLLPLRCEGSFTHSFHIIVYGEIIKGSEFLYFRMYFSSDSFTKYCMCRICVTDSFPIFWSQASKGHSSLKGSWFLWVSYFLWVYLCPSLQAVWTDRDSPILSSFFCFFCF